MSSRQEEKQRRKEERLAAERAEAGAAQRKRLVQIVAGVVVAAAVVVGIVLAVTADGGSGDTAGGDAAQSADVAPGVELPPQREEDLEAAVEAAGCTFEEFENFGQEHTDETLTPADFETNPATSGQHNPIPAQDGIYEAGNSPPLPNWVHTLEHGRIIFTYAPGTPQERIDQLKLLWGEEFNNNPEGYHSVVLENNTEMPFQVAAVAWRRYVACEEFTPRVFDAFRAFRSTYVDQAPELVP